MAQVGSGPCLDCVDREVGCHSTCIRYIQWQAERNELLAADRMRNIHLQSSMYTLGDAHLSFKHFGTKRDR